MYGYCKEKIDVAHYEDLKDKGVAGERVINGKNTRLPSVWPSQVQDPVSL